MRVRECRKHGCPKPTYTISPGNPGDLMVCVKAASDAVVVESAKPNGADNVTLNDTLNVTLNDTLIPLYELIRDNPGRRSPFFVQRLGKTARTVKRQLAELAGKIEFRGPSRTGGYYLKEREKAAR